MDGNYGGSLDLRLLRADTVVWFDYARHVCVGRALWRVLTTHSRVRPDLAPGCPEQFDGQFLRYIWAFNIKNRPTILAALAAHGRHLTPIVVRRDADAARFLARLAMK
jgi:adenylate kinase family enzyme